MQYIFAVHPALEREHRQNQQRQQPDPRIAQRGKRQRTQTRYAINAIAKRLIIPAALETG